LCFNEIHNENDDVKLLNLSQLALCLGLDVERRMPVGSMVIELIT